MNRLGLLLLVLLAPLVRADESAVKAALGREILSSRQTLLDVQEFVEPRLPALPGFESASEWSAYASGLRKQILEGVVLRGAARGWDQAACKVELLETIPGGKGYSLRRLRYEALPGMWIPAILYTPDRLAGKVPVMLAVNGHDPKGKAAEYKQMRCINLAKRGMLVLNVEWFGMGQLRQPGHQHGCMNQLDLCGTSGLAPFYLAMRRGLDVLLARPGADPARVAVSGLSGGGWQTIFISALDPRVTLANPVAGYSGFKIRLRDHFKDLGDSEQTPVDLATVADYTHLTALRAPRPTLLTYNAKDECCFEAGYALPPLLTAARPVFALLGRAGALRSHVNHDPGTHNFERENREVLYRMIGDHFYPGDRTYSATEIACKDELRSMEELYVELPKENASFHTLARDLARSLPREATTVQRRKELARVVRQADWEVQAKEVARTTERGTTAVLWRLQVGKSWSVPVVELTRGTAGEKTAILINDGGRKADPVHAERLLKAGYRVLAMDPFYFGEARVAQKDWLFALLIATVGERPLGVQSSQLAAVARWAAKQHGTAGVHLVAVGPRTSVAALVAGALEARAIRELELHGVRASLKEIIAENRTVDQMPELFCFGLLEVADVPQLVALVAPRPVQLRK